MPTVKGRTEVKRFFAQVPVALASRIVPAAARVGGKVIAEEAKDRSISKRVSKAIKVRVSKTSTHVIARIQVRGEGSYLAPWLEYGTAPHVISVADDRDRRGFGIGRINRLAKAGTLVIAGKPIGKVVEHPGTEPHPFLHVSLDTKRDEAIAAAQAYVTTRLKRSGLAATSDDREDA